jgi:nucleotide-binding universal stress UspA family protein
MTFKTLLAHAEPEWGSGDSLSVALQVARMFDAHLLGVAAEAFELPGYGMIDGELVQLLRDNVDTDIAAAKARFLQAATDAPAGSTFISGVDRPLTLMKRHARGADLVVARRVAHDSSVTNLCRPTDLVLDVGAPVLLAPHDPPPLEARRIVVAWKDRPEARRALTEALPLLVRADKVILAAFCPDKTHRTARDELHEVAARLGRHGVKATAMVAACSGASVATDIEDLALKQDADLIVAGAYSHNRMSEWVLGGVTQDLLTDCSRYVFFSR